MNKIIDSNGVIHNLRDFPFYNIQQLCETMVNKAMEDEQLREIYENNYANKITKFSPEFQFCLHELGFVIHDPFNLGNDEVMFSNGNRCYIAASSYIEKEGFNRKNIQNNEIGFPILLDSTLKLEKSNIDPGLMGNGIIDNDSYIDTTFIKSKENFAQMYLMNIMIDDKEVYEDYKSNRQNYSSTIEYLVQKLGFAETKVNENGELELNYSESLHPGTKDIIDFVLEGSLIEEEKVSQKVA